MFPTPTSVHPSCDYDQSAYKILHRSSQSEDTELQRAAERPAKIVLKILHASSISPTGSFHSHSTPNSYLSTQKGGRGGGGCCPSVCVGA